MKVTVRPQVEAGTDRGGEDLFLVFEAEGPEQDELTVEPADGDLHWVFDGDDPEDPDAVWSCRTDHYGFEWRGSLRGLRALAQEAAADADSWRWSGPATEEPKKVLKHRHFVDGNAD